MRGMRACMCVCCVLWVWVYVFGLREIIIERLEICLVLGVYIFMIILAEAT